MTPRQVRNLVGCIAVTGAVGISLFQALLALGIPLGKMAWGGASAELSISLRISSAIAVILWWMVAAVFGTRAGFWHSEWMPLDWAVQATWVVFGLLCANCLLNWASRSPMERNIWGPVTTIMVLSTFGLAKSQRPDSVEEMPLVVHVPYRFRRQARCYL